MDNVDSDNEEEINNLINNSDREFITQFIAEFILSANNTLDNSLTTLEANIQVVRDNEESKKPDKKKKDEPWKWIKKAKTNKQEPIALTPEIQAELNEIVSPMEIFELVTGLEELIDLLVVQTNLYAQQKWRNFTVDNNELKAFLEINYIMAINKLPTIAKCWTTWLEIISFKTQWFETAFVKYFKISVLQTIRMIIKQIESLK